VIPSSAAAVAEEWTIPLRGVCSAVAPSAAGQDSTTVWCVAAAARPLCRAHAQDHISILIDAERFSRHITRLVRRYFSYQCSPISEITLHVECSQTSPVCPSGNTNVLVMEDIDYKLRSTSALFKAPVRTARKHVPFRC
jgi:hypothetical protein